VATPGTHENRNSRPGIDLCHIWPTDPAPIFTAARQAHTSYTAVGKTHQERIAVDRLRPVRVGSRGGRVLRRQVVLVVVPAQGGIPRQSIRPTHRVSRPVGAAVVFVDTEALAGGRACQRFWTDFERSFLLDGKIRTSITSRCPRLHRPSPSCRPVSSGTPRCVRQKQPYLRHHRKTKRSDRDGGRSHFPYGRKQ
jgi:hypothetical protein